MLWIYHISVIIIIIFQLTRSVVVDTAYFPMNNTDGCSIKQSLRLCRGTYWLIRYLVVTRTWEGLNLNRSTLYSLYLDRFIHKTSFGTRSITTYYESITGSKKQLTSQRIDDGAGLCIEKLRNSFVTTASAINRIVMIQFVWWYWTWETNELYWGAQSHWWSCWFTPSVR